MDEPVTILSFKVISLKASEFQIINSSASLEICIEHTDDAKRKSKTKSLSETVSPELFVGFLKPSFVVKFLSILKDVQTMQQNLMVFLKTNIIIF